MGRAVSVSQYVGQLRRAGGAAKPLLNILTDKLKT
jgi:hypothetical protein